MKHALGTIEDAKTIEKIRQHFGFDKFVGEFQSPINGEVSTSGMLFWSKEVAPEVYERVKNPNDVSNYGFVYYHPLHGMLIRNGKEVANKVRNGIITPCGGFIYSRHRHDYNEHEGCMIDGGEDYTRFSGDGRVVEFIIVDGEIKEKVRDAV